MSQFLLILLGAIAYFVWKYFFGDKEDKLEAANQRIGALELESKNAMMMFVKEQVEHRKLQEQFEKLQHQKISADVKMGHKSENLAPFLDEFPYPAECVRGLFNPIDLIAFTEDEVIFIEVKSGAAQLSEKQRRIRDNIKAGRVKFEVVRMNEKGVTVK